MQIFEQPNGHLGPFFKAQSDNIARRQAALVAFQTVQTKIAPIEKFLGHFGFNFVLHSDSVGDSLKMRIDSNRLETDKTAYWITSYYEPELKKRGFLLQGAQEKEIDASVTKPDMPSSQQFQFALSSKGKIVKQAEAPEPIIRDLALALGTISDDFLARSRQAWRKTLPLAGELSGQPGTHRVPGYNRAIQMAAAKNGLHVELRK